MAPWPDRVDSQRSIDRSPSRGGPSQLRRPHASSVSSSSRFTSATRVTDREILDSLQLEADTSSSSEEDLHPSSHPPRRPTGHARSMSHPFPSLFSSKKKRSGQVADDNSTSESPNEAGHMPKLKVPLKVPPQRGHRNGSSAAGSRDYTTGQCMTCGSLVRWPRGLHVFKCTICVTINDLQPIDWAVKKEGGRDFVPAAVEDYFEPNNTPISLAHTKALATHCLRSFLESTLRQRSRRASYGAQGLESSYPPPQSGDRIATSTVMPLPIRSRASDAFYLQPPRPGAPEPLLHENPLRHPNTMSRSCSTSFPEGRPAFRDLNYHSTSPSRRNQPPSPGNEPRRMFKQLEDYVVGCFTSYQCLNFSFTAHRSGHYSRHGVEGVRRQQQQHREQQQQQPEPRKTPPTADYPIVDLDAKLLLLGNFAENGSWWSGGQEDLIPGRTASNRSDNGQSNVSTRNPRIDWQELEEWYMFVIEAARSWPTVYAELVDDDPTLTVSSAVLQELEAQILAGQDHAQRTLLKASETILRRPGRPIRSPHEMRFILIISANPLLHATYKSFAGTFKHTEADFPGRSPESPRGTGPASGRHSLIIKRIVGLMSNSPSECHNQLVAWFARYPESMFVQLKDLVSGFLAYRLIRQTEKKYEAKIDVTDGLIPSMGAGRSPASLHAALGHTSQSGKKQRERKKRIIYQDDWQIKASAQVLGFLFAANNMGHTRSRHGSRPNSAGYGTANELVQRRGRALATSDFYMTLLDDSDLMADFEAWEQKTAKFAFCQYPFLLSIGAKIQILEHDAKRQMDKKAREAFFDSIMSHRVIQQYLVLDIRRECLVEDSLKAVSEVVSGSEGDVKKGLKINFKGEEGVDAGGLKKEWFLLLVREVFNPDHGMFIYDEDSQYCYFNPNALEPSQQFFLVGVVFGLAIYNSIILDVALPPFTFRKLLAAAPPPSVPTLQPRQAITYNLSDLAEYRPRLARSFRQLLDYDGDVESSFCLDFVIPTDRYGLIENISLCPGGEHRAVTNANRKEYVDLYVRHVLDTAVTRQFEPFKRGFFKVCGGNALSLFRPEEIELLVRGSDEPLDISSLKAVAGYDNWGTAGDPAEDEPIVQWFWDTFERASPADQRKLLLFITGSDRIPAMGAASLSIRISCLGEDCGRYPTARTCFNVLALWRYPTRRRLEELLWAAVFESEGFGLK
ncbi:hypothetical protein B0T17DRAFT_485498 [Bombardia bombarda]|uniref:HECT-type E3 ubiquitin transferase n=1 Tax=Bombardia bombarda TaxID=252184 RepID=A0AA39XIK2_9PEZI|nr:hypothetical protein B0T17DRAFT_485498 [Bombardia bombarda]